MRGRKAASDVALRAVGDHEAMGWEPIAEWRGRLCGTQNQTQNWQPGAIFLRL